MSPCVRDQWRTPTEGVLAQVTVAKRADHTPLHRKSRILARSGIQIDRSTLASWGEDRSRWDRSVQWTDRRNEPAKRRTERSRSTSGLRSTGWLSASSAQPSASCPCGNCRQSPTG
ncbi:MAG: transposase [Pseudomonadota bacterium]